MSGDISMTMLVEAILKSNSPSKVPRSYYPSSPSSQHHHHHRPGAYHHHEVDAFADENDTHTANISHNPIGTIHARPTSASSDVSFGHGGEDPYLTLYDSPVPFPRRRRPSLPAQFEPCSSSSRGTTTEGDAIEQFSSPDTFYSAELPREEEREDVPSACQWTASSGSMMFATSLDTPHGSRHARGLFAFGAESFDEHGVRGSAHPCACEAYQPTPPRRSSGSTRDPGSTRGLGVSHSSRRPQRIATPPNYNTPRKISLPVFRRHVKVEVNHADSDSDSNSRRLFSSPGSRSKSNSAAASSRHHGDGTFRWGFRPVNTPEKVTLAKKLWRKLKAMTKSSPSESFD